jgi:D-alanyl-lipoteichoic acid acyltransferase DltB (MBOAT superfamily)
MAFATVSYFMNLAIVEIGVLWLAVWLSPEGRRYLLCVIGIAALFYITPRLILIYATFWSLVAIPIYFQGSATSPRVRRVVFVCGIAGALGPMLAFKVFPFEFWLAWNRDAHSLLATLFPPIEELDRLRPIITAIGLSFAVFRAMDLIIKVYIGKIGPIGFGSIMQYGFFAPVIVTGPIIEYEEIQKPTAVVPEIVLAAALTGAIGILKIFAASFLLREFADISSVDAHNLKWRWILVLVHPWYFYLNFAGYSDIAIGLAALYGFKLKPNFNNPFLQSSVQDFWANWHMSLTRWAQRNIFVPLGGYRPEKQYLALVFTMLTIAFWHDISISLLIFGLYHSSALVLQRLLSSNGRSLPLKGSMAGRVIRTLATYLFVALSFPMLELPLDRLGSVYSSLLGQ